MNPDQLNKILKSVGIGSTIVLTAILVYGGFSLYTSYLEGINLKLQIQQRKRDLNIPD